MKDIVNSGVALLGSGEAFAEFGGGQVAKEDGGAFRDGTSGGFGNIPDRHVHRPCCLKYESLVLSDATISGMTVASSGRLSYQSEINELWS